MLCRNCWYLLLTVLIVDCSSTRVASDAETQARRHMSIADTLEHASALKEATLEYALIAERFQSTSVYPIAVRKAALLFSAPSNPVASDSASLYWLTTYLNLTKSPEEKQIIQMYLTLAERVRGLRDSLDFQRSLNDSLAVTFRKQAGEATSRIRRIQELEAQLQKASDELLKLKEIDMRISKSRGKNKP